MRAATGSEQISTPGKESMAMANFKRGLDDEFVDRLNEVYRARGWWHSLVNDRDLFIAIRDNYLNVYYRGGSVLKLKWRPRDRKMSVKFITSIF